MRGGAGGVARGEHGSVEPAEVWVGGGGPRACGGRAAECSLDAARRLEPRNNPRMHGLQGETGPGRSDVTLETLGTENVSSPSSQLCEKEIYTFYV